MSTRAMMTTVLVVLLAAVSIQAGDQFRGVRDFGIRVGFGLATVGTTVDEFDDLDSYLGASIGGFVTYGIGPKLSLQTELLLAGKGAGGELFRGRSFRHTYLEIPILLNYSLAGGTGLKPKLYLGPALAFLLSAEFKSAIFSDVVDPGDAAKSYDFGIAFGGALAYKHFELDVRYTIGIVNIYDPAEWNRLVEADDPQDLYYMADDDTIKNRFLAFTLGYRF